MILKFDPEKVRKLLRKIYQEAEKEEQLRKNKLKSEILDDLLTEDDNAKK